MPAARLPEDETGRLAELTRYGLVAAPATVEMHGATELAAIVTDSPMAVINIIERDRQVPLAGFGTEGAVCKRSDSMCAHVVAAGSMIHTPDASTDHRFTDSVWVNGELASVRLYAGVPLRSASGHVLGSLCVVDTQVRELSAGQQRALRCVADQVVALFELHQRSRRLTVALAALEQLSRADTLTGLGNRRSLSEALGRGRAGDPVRLLFCDLDGFKHINDRLGHDVGDEVLVEVAHRLAAVARSTDIVARHGGDEFVVVACGADDTAAAALARRLRAAVCEPYLTSAGTVSVGVSIGIAEPAAGETVEQVLRRADAHMYEDKRSRRGVLPAQGGRVAARASTTG